MGQQIQDDGFHEIQLNGKQLVFLFMAATVVSVVIFLCGVLVGRGVRAERGIAPDSAASIASGADPAPAPAASTLVPPPVGSDPTAAAPPATEELGYYDRLQKSNGPKEHLKPVAPEHAPSETASTVGKGAAKPASERSAALLDKPERLSPVPEKSSRPAKETARTAANAAPASPSADGFAVQIAALNVRSEADAIAKRLSSKGYAAYVLSPASGTPSVYRVRIGKFPTRREAESVAARLQREEQFKPWVTR